MTEADLYCPRPQLSHQLWLEQDGFDPEAGTRSWDTRPGMATQHDDTNTALFFFGPTDVIFTV